MGGPPDLTPTYLYSFTTYPPINGANPGITQDILISIAEINNVATSGFVEFRIPGSIGFIYAIPTGVGVPATVTYLISGQPTVFPVQNNDWDVVSDGTGGFVLTLKAGNSIPAGGNSYVLLRSSASSPGGRGSITTTITAGSGGETRFNNNAVVLRQSIQR